MNSTSEGTLNQLNLFPDLPIEHVQRNANCALERVYRSVASSGSSGATADEVEVATGIIIQTITPRLNELRKAKRIRKTGGKRLTRWGVEADIHVALEVSNNE